MDKKELLYALLEYYMSLGVFKSEDIPRLLGYLDTLPEQELQDLWKEINGIK